MKAIHGGKAKNDQIDAAKIAGLLRGGLFPMAYVYPRDMRETRDLLRRRTYFVRQRAQLIAHIVNTNSQYNLPPFDRKLSRHPDYSELAERFAHASTRLSIGADASHARPRWLWIGPRARDRCIPHMRTRVRQSPGFGRPARRAKHELGRCGAAAVAPTRPGSRFPGGVAGRGPSPRAGVEPVALKRRRTVRRGFWGAA